MAQRKFRAKKIPLRAKKEGESYGRFLKMIDDLQTPKHKTNHKYRRCLKNPLFFPKWETKFFSGN